MINYMDANMLSYRSGESVQVGDRILWDGGRYVVFEVIEPKTEEAEGYQCFDDGGILTIPIGYADFFLMHPNDEEILFDHRGRINDKENDLHYEW